MPEGQGNNLLTVKVRLRDRGDAQHGLALVFADAGGFGNSLAGIRVGARPIYRTPSMLRRHQFDERAAAADRAGFDYFFPRRNCTMAISEAMPPRIAMIRAIGLCMGAPSFALCSLDGAPDIVEMPADFRVSYLTGFPQLLPTFERPWQPRSRA